MTSHSYVLPSNLNAVLYLSFLATLICQKPDFKSIFVKILAFLICRHSCIFAIRYVSGSVTKLTPLMFIQNRKVGFPSSPLFGAAVHTDEKVEAHSRMIPFLRSVL